MGLKSENDSNSTNNQIKEILDNILSISKVSYDQENERSKQLLSKSDYIIKYISVITVLVNIFLPLAFTNKLIDIKLLIVMYFIVSIPLILSLFFSIRAQILRPGKFFPTGKAVISEIQKCPEKLNNSVKIINKYILYYSSSTQELQDSNDKRAKILKSAYTSYLTSIFTLIAIVIIMMIIIA